jgi:hypothetical protein
MYLQHLEINVALAIAATARRTETRSMLPCRLSDFSNKRFSPPNQPRFWLLFSSVSPSDLSNLLMVELVAKLVIEFAQQGEREPTRWNKLVSQAILSG